MSAKTEQLLSYFRLIQTANWIELKLKEEFRPYKLTHAQFNVLRILKGSNPRPLSAGEIKQRMIVKSPDLTRLIDRLCKKDYVRRVTCAGNRRKVDISITDTGLALLDELSPKIKQVSQTHFLDKISKEEARSLNQILKKIKP